MCQACLSELKVSSLQVMNADEGLQGCWYELSVCDASTTLKADGCQARTPPSKRPHARLLIAVHVKVNAWSAWPYLVIIWGVMYRFEAVVKRKVAKYVLVCYNELMDEANPDEHLLEWFSTAHGTPPLSKQAAAQHKVHAGEGYKLRPQPRPKVIHDRDG